MQQKAPSKLLRIELASFCNMQCTFCCWENPYKPKEQAVFPSDKLKYLCSAFIETECNNFNITGGEPLLLPTEYLCNTVKAISSVDKVKELWITTNGIGFLNDNICTELAAAGLTDVAISIAAGTDVKYLKYTNNAASLIDVIDAIKNAGSHGIRVRVNVPLTPSGIEKYQDILKLISRLSDTGVKSLYYFGLHNSDKINTNFNKIYVNPQSITNGFASDSDWTLGQTASGRYYFTNGQFNVMIPRPSLHQVTKNCKSLDCGSFCQGIYSAYCIPVNQGWAVRACHRNFNDKRNLFLLPMGSLTKENWNSIVPFLKNMWSFAYEKE